MQYLCYRKKILTILDVMLVYNNKDTAKNYEITFITNRSD
jgi:hypothetical protein